MSLGNINYNTPLVDLPVAGNKITYNALNINFAVDESFNSWTQLQLWFRAIASPKSFAERNQLTATQNTYKTNQRKSYSDASLTLLSALNNPLIRIKFYNVFPTSLSDISLDTKSSADDIITADASFMYEYFDIENIAG